MKMFLICLLFVLVPSANADVPAAIRLGWIGPLTGSAAILGVDALPAVELALEESEGLELVVEDDQYDTAKTVAAYNRLVHYEGIRILFVMTYGGLFALAPRAEKDGVLLIDALDCDEHIGRLPESVICIAKTTEQIGELNADAALKRGERRAALFYYNSDPFMGTVADSTVARLKASGVTPLYTEGYVAGTTDFRAMLLRARESGVQSLFLYGYDEIGHLMRQARELGLKGTFYATNTAASPGLRDLAKGADEGTVISSYKAPRTKAYRDFIERFERKKGRPPQFEVSTFPSYDAAKLVIAGLRDAPTSDAARMVREYLLSVRDYAGLSGTISIDPDGVTRTLASDVFVMRNGELVKE